MSVTLAQITVQAFGILIGLASLAGLASPDRLIAIVRNVASTPSGWIFAVVVRIVLGAALITAAQAAVFPAAFVALGWAAIVAAIGLLIMGQTRMRKLVDRVGRLSAMAIRVWLIFGLAFGALLLLGA